MEIFSRIKEKYLRKHPREGACQWATSLQAAATPRPRREGLWGPRGTTAPKLSSISSVSHGKKNQREGFIAFYDTEASPPPVLHLEGRSGVRSGLRRGEIDAIVIINHPPSQIA